MVLDECSVELVVSCFLRTPTVPRSENLRVGSDDFPFQLGDFLGSKNVNFPGCIPAFLFTGGFSRIG